MKRVRAFMAVLILCALRLHAQAPDPSTLPKVKRVALVVRATTSISCGDGSEGTCLRTDGDVVKKVIATVDGTYLWVVFEKADATKADAIVEVTVKNATTTYGTISFSVRDADSNKFLYYDSRDVVMLENDVTRIVNHFLDAFEDAKKKPTSTKKQR
jgi:hypothetical protein